MSRVAHLGAGEELVASQRVLTATMEEDEEAAAKLMARGTVEKEVDAMVDKH